MAVRQRSFAGPADFAAVSDFLTQLYRPGNRDGNWLQPVWEYAYTHPWFDESSSGRIGIWEDGGEMVAVATYESRLGEAFFNVRADYAHLKPEMLDYAEARLSEVGADGRRYLKAYVNDFDAAFEAVVAARGYRLDPDERRPMSQLELPAPFPTPALPVGFGVQSLADENDLAKIDRVLWRGFNHPGEPPAGGEEDRRKMQSGPHFRKDLTMVAVAANGDFVSYTGLWYDAVNRFAYVEPVATDPDYRRLGLARAALMEGIRRCAEEGATVAYVGSEQPFYRALGFGRVYTENCWLKALS